ncbi:MAG: hypothetical protein JWM95_469 [Gemmatimonadetes bacterium]|nr:hypothetical protein [Gemmatimonadota bacterium]
MRDDITQCPDIRCAHPGVHIVTVGLASGISLGIDGASVRLFFLSCVIFAHNTHGGS